MKQQVHFIMAVWGRAYVDMFLDVALASLLAPNNIPAVAWCDDLDPRFKVYTSCDDMDYMQEHPRFQKLQRLVAVEIIPVDDSFGGDKFSPLIQLHNRSIYEAEDQDAVLVFLSPDFIMADGAIWRLIEIWAEGYRSVMILTLRLNHDSMRAELAKRFPVAKDASLTIKARELVALALPHLHDIEKGYFWDTGESCFPIHSYWPVEDEGLTARCFYLHPILVAPSFTHVYPKGTIDADFVDRTCNQHEVYIVQDSDELTCFELSSKKMRDENSAIRSPVKRTPRSFAKWSLVNANPAYPLLHHHWFFQARIRIHSGVQSPLWKEAEKKASSLASRVKLWCCFLLLEEGGEIARKFGQVVSSPHNALQEQQSESVHASPKREFVTSRLFCLFKSRVVLSEGFIDMSHPIGVGGAYFRRVRTKCTQDMILRTVFSGGDGQGLEVCANGVPLETKSIVRLDRLWHVCELPSSVFKKGEGDIEISYCFVSQFGRSSSLTLHYAELVPKRKAMKLGPLMVKQPDSLQLSKYDVEKMSTKVPPFCSEMRAASKGRTVVKSIRLFLCPFHDYRIITMFDECRGWGLTDLILCVNGRVIPNQQFSLLDKYCLTCDLPASFINDGGESALTYELTSRHSIKRLSISSLKIAIFNKNVMESLVSGDLSVRGARLSRVFLKKRRTLFGILGVSRELQFRGRKPEKPVENEVFRLENFSTSLLRMISGYFKKTLTIGNNSPNRLNFAISPITRGDLVLVVKYFSSHPSIKRTLRINGEILSPAYIDQNGECCFALTEVPYSMWKESGGIIQAHYEVQREDEVIPIANVIYYAPRWLFRFVFALFPAVVPNWWRGYMESVTRSR